MLKNTFFTLIVVIFIKLSYCQEASPYPRSIVDIGFGLGPNYGIVGIKTVLGIKGSGVLLGIGVLPGTGLGYEVGLQATQKWWFLNMGYGVYGAATNIATGENQQLAGLIVITGGKINLNKSKKAFLELGIGYAGGDRIDLPGTQGPTTGGLNAVIGLGFRLGGKKSEQSVAPAE